MARAVSMLSGPAAQAEFRRAMLKAARALNPSPARQHLELLAFAAAVIRGAPAPFATEYEQYVYLYHEKRAQLGRAPWTTESAPLRAVSHMLWNAIVTTRAGDRPQ